MDLPKGHSNDLCGFSICSSIGTSIILKWNIFEDICHCVYLNQFLVHFIRQCKFCKSSWALDTTNWCKFMGRILPNFSICTSIGQFNLLHITWNLLNMGNVVVPCTYSYFCNSFIYSCLVLSILNFAKMWPCSASKSAGIAAAGMLFYHCNAVPDNIYFRPPTWVTSLWNLSACNCSHCLNLLKNSSTSISTLSPVNVSGIKSLKPLTTMMHGSTSSGIMRLNVTQYNFFSS